MPQLPNQTPGQSISNQLPESQPTPQPAKHFPRPLILGLLLIILALSATVAYLLFTQSQKDKASAINSYEECVAAGNPVMKSYPEQCVTEDGISFTNQTTDENDKITQDQVQVDPTNIAVPIDWVVTSSSPLNITLKHPSSWFTSDNTASQLRIQNYDPKTAIGRGYDPNIDAGKISLSLSPYMPEETISDVASLISILSETETICYYMGENFGTSQVSNEDIINQATYTIYKRDKKCSEANVINNEIFFIDNLGGVIQVLPGMDYKSDEKLVNQILSTFEFTD